MKLTLVVDFSIVGVDSLDPKFLEQKTIFFFFSNLQSFFFFLIVVLWSIKVNLSRIFIQSESFIILFKILVTSYLHFSE